MITISQKLQVVGQHCYRLRWMIVTLLVCWYLLIFQFPTEGDQVPRWWTAVYALAKVGLAVCVAHIAVHGLFPNLRLTRFVDDYYDAQRPETPQIAVAAALAFCGACFVHGMLYGVLIYAVAVW